MNTNKLGRTPIYDNAVKVAIAREYLTGNLGYTALAKKYGLALHTVKGFIRWYRKYYPEDLQPPGKVEEPGKVDSNKEQISKQLKQANLKIAGLEMLIETVQKELGVDFVKKPGTKRS